MALNRHVIIFLITHKILSILKICAYRRLKIIMLRLLLKEKTMDKPMQYRIVRVYNADWTERTNEEIEKDMNDLYKQGYFFNDMNGDFIIFELMLDGSM